MKTQTSTSAMVKLNATIETAEKAENIKDLAYAAYLISYQLVELGTKGSLNKNEKIIKQLYSRISDKAIMQQVAEVYQYALNTKKLKHYGEFPDCEQFEKDRMDIVNASRMAFEYLTNNKKPVVVPRNFTLHKTNQKLRHQISRVVMDELEKRNAQLTKRVEQLEKFRSKFYWASAITGATAAMIILLMIIKA